jgi:hypothetical protein
VRGMGVGLANLTPLPAFYRFRARHLVAPAQEVSPFDEDVLCGEITSHGISIHAEPGIPTRCRFWTCSQSRSPEMERQLSFAFALWLFNPRPWMIPGTSLLEKVQLLKVPVRKTASGCGSQGAKQGLGRLKMESGVGLAWGCRCKLG